MNEKKNTKKDMPVINYTKEAFGKLTSKTLIDVITPRISNLIAKKELVKMIKNGDVVFTNPVDLSEWTYKAVVVVGTDLSKIVGKKIPEVTLTVDEFKALTNDQVAKYIEDHTTEKTAAAYMFAIVEAGQILTAEQVVRITNSRITVEGVTVTKNSNKRTARVVSLTGIKLSHKLVN